MNKPDSRNLGALRDTPSFRSMIEGNTASATLKDYGMQSIVRLEWDLNKEAARDKIFKIKINDQEALVDLEELLHYTRLV